MWRRKFPRLAPRSEKPSRRSLARNRKSSRLRALPRRNSVSGAFYSLHPMPSQLDSVVELRVCSAWNTCLPGLASLSTHKIYVRLIEYEDACMRHLQDEQE